MKRFSLCAAVLVWSVAGQAQAISLWQAIAPETPPAFHAGGNYLSSDTPHRWYHNAAEVSSFRADHIEGPGPGWGDDCGHGYGGCGGCVYKDCLRLWDGYCQERCRWGELRNRWHAKGGLGSHCGHGSRCGHGSCCQPKCHRPKCHRPKCQRPKCCKPKCCRLACCHLHLFDWLHRACGCFHHHDCDCGESHGGEAIEGPGPKMPVPLPEQPVETDLIDPPAPTPDVSAQRRELLPKRFGIFSSGRE